jgi:23S rRNA pseudouridine1911/1915/1917 synthase
MSAETSIPAEATASLTVNATHAGKRLDRYLVDALPELSRARVRTLLDEGRVRVNGRRQRKGDLVREGDTVVVTGELPPQDFSPRPDPAIVMVPRYEDAAVAVLDKPAGVATHPLRPDELGTFANGIVLRYPETREVGYKLREPGLLHRLDTDTSGLLIVARSRDVFERLRGAMRSGDVVKRYLALVEGRVVSEGVVDLPLVPHRKDPKRVEVVTEHVRLRAGTRTHEGLTRYRPTRALGEYTLVEVELESAFRHQVRAHLAAIGHPLVGDRLYRGPALTEDLGVSLARHFLHASEVVFPHPVSGAEVRVTSPLPDELSAVVGALKARVAT